MPNTPAMLGDVAGLFIRLDLKNDILRRFKSIECGGLTVELISQHDNEMTHLGRRRHGFCFSRTIASTRGIASRSEAGMAPVSGMLRQYFFGMCCRIAAGLARAGLNMLS